ncbi:hypothetical protein ABZ791_02075 [Streptomyces huasconensis]|uniref:Uncharacterized protein n=1 Tax=Streptomyces huasconensis TaxID=1854574 RepID=A0ABV3LRL5_9ACTN
MTTTQGQCAISVYPPVLPPRDTASADGGPGVLVRVTDLGAPCRAVRVRLPAGDSATARAEVDAADWEITEPGPGTVEARPVGGAAATAPDSGTIAVRLHGLRPPSDGPLELGVTVLFDGGPEAVTSRHFIDRGVRGLAPITDFRPRFLAIAYRERTVLQWRRSDEDKDGYSLQRHDTTGSSARYGLEPAHLTLENGTFTYQDQNALTHTTAFTLFYEKAADEVRAATAVIVAGGDIEAGRLTVNGQVKMVKPPQNCVSKGKGTFKFKPAPTDGVLSAVLTYESESKAGRVDRAELTVRVTPSGQQPIERTLRIIDAKQRENLQLPVPQGAGVTIMTTGEAARAEAVWFPFGLAGRPGHLVHADAGAER